MKHYLQTFWKSSTGMGYINWRMEQVQLREIILEIYYKYKLYDKYKLYYKYKSVLSLSLRELLEQQHMKFM